MLVYSRENQTRPKLLVLACQSADMELRAAWPFVLVVCRGFGLWIRDCCSLPFRCRSRIGGNTLQAIMLDRLLLQMGYKSLFQVDPTLLVFSFWNKKRLLAKNLLGLPPRIFFSKQKGSFEGEYQGNAQRF